MVKFRQKHMIQTTATINKTAGFVQAIAGRRPWREAVQAYLLGQEQPNRFAEFVQFTKR